MTYLTIRKSKFSLFFHFGESHFVNPMIYRFGAQIYSGLFGYFAHSGGVHHGGSTSFQTMPFWVDFIVSLFQENEKSFFFMFDIKNLKIKCSSALNNAEPPQYYSYRKGRSSSSDQQQLQHFPAQLATIAPRALPVDNAVVGAPQVQAAHIDMVGGRFSAVKCGSGCIVIHGINLLSIGFALL